MKTNNKKIKIDSTILSDVVEPPINIASRPSNDVTYNISIAKTLDNPTIDSSENLIQLNY